MKFAGAARLGASSGYKEPSAVIASDIEAIQTGGTEDGWRAALRGLSLDCFASLAMTDSSVLHKMPEQPIQAAFEQDVERETEVAVDGKLQ